jgi:hypothetical protein
MAEPTQYSFDLTEVATLLVKQQGLHEGKWLLAFEFHMTAGNFGPTPAEARPGAIVQFGKILLARKEDTSPDTHGVVDAAKVNPPKQDRVSSDAATASGGNVPAATSAPRRHRRKSK